LRTKHAVSVFNYLTAVTFIGGLSKSIFSSFISVTNSFLLNLYSIEAMYTDEHSLHVIHTTLHQIGQWLHLFVNIYFHDYADICFFSSKDTS